MIFDTNDTTNLIADTPVFDINDTTDLIADTPDV